MKRARGFRYAARAFTLLEVLVAISILGIGLTVILSSQVGLFSSTQRAENLTLASQLVRCRMSETEVELLKNGFQLLDQTDEGPCCADESETFFQCKRAIERIELPQPAGFDSDGGAAPVTGDTGAAPASASLNLGGALSFDAGSSGIASGLGPLSALAAVQQTGGAALAGSEMSSLSGMLSGGAFGGAEALIPTVMSMVYPDLKSMLEASIRKVTITVHWKEGKNERELAVTQYITNPIQGGIDPNAAKGLEALDTAATQGSGTGSGTQGAGFGLPGAR